MKETHMKKIYIVSWFGCSNIGGVERVVQYMVDSWKNDYTVEIIDFERIRKCSMYNLLLGKYHGLDSILVSIYVNGILKKDKTKSILVTNGYNCPFAKSDLLFSHGTMRGYKVACGKGKTPIWQISQIYEKIAQKKAKRVVCVSQNAADESKKYYNTDEEKIYILENCVNTAVFFPNKNVREDLKTINVIFCGTLETRKGVDVLYRYAKLIEKYEDMRLLIATQKENNTELFLDLKNTKIYKSLKREDLNSFYNLGDIMLFPSRYEGFEMVTTECLAAGVPVIGNAIGAIGHIHRIGLEGVFLLDELETKNIELMREKAILYRDEDKKAVLHSNMKKYFGMEQYQLKLKKLVKGCI